jgi:hypothetical protein
MAPESIGVEAALPEPDSAMDRVFRLLAAAAVIAGLTAVDQASGYQLNLLLFYALPIAWAAWSVNFTWAAVLIVLSTVARVRLDAGVHHYAHHWIPWERASMRILMTTFIAFSFHQFRRDLDRRETKVRQLEGILPVCIACNRISDALGHWTDLDVYLRRHSEARPEARLCPDCAGLRLH